jgi:hypothetical protein
MPSNTQIKLRLNTEKEELKFNEFLFDINNKWKCKFPNHDQIIIRYEIN